MIKLNCYYARKCPGPEDFSSKQFSAGMEIELSDSLSAAEIRGKVNELHRELRNAVESELSSEAAPVPVNGNSHNNGNGARKISNAQCKFILDLARQNSVTVDELDTMIGNEYGCDGLYDMSGRDASKLIHALKSRQAAA